MNAYKQTTCKDKSKWGVFGLNGEPYAQFEFYHEAKEFYDKLAWFEEVTLRRVYSNVSME